MLKEIKIGEEVTIKTHSPLAIEICEKTEWEHYIKLIKNIIIMLPVWVAGKKGIAIRETASDTWSRIDKPWAEIKNMPTILKKVDKK